MSALDDYEGPGKVFFGANALAQAKSVRFNINGNNRRVYTMKKGLAGRSRGPVETEITVDNAVPIAGLEQEYIERCVDNANVRIEIELAGKRYSWDGWIDTVEGSQSTDADAGLSYTVVAGPPQILGAST
jgi:hypothetical protein